AQRLDRLVHARQEVRTVEANAGVEDGVDQPQAVDVVVDVVQQQRVQHLTAEVGERVVTGLARGSEPRLFLGRRVVLKTDDQQAIGAEPEGRREWCVQAQSAV